MIEYELLYDKIFSLEEKKQLGKCTSASKNFNWQCFELIFNKLYSKAKDSSKDLNVFFALMDGLSMDYNKKSYEKIISNLKSIKKNKIQINMKNIDIFWYHN